MTDHTEHSACVKSPQQSRVVDPRELLTAWDSAPPALIAIRDEMADQYLLMGSARSLDQARYLASVSMMMWGGDENRSRAVALGIVAGPNLDPVDLDSPAFLAAAANELTALRELRLLVTEPAGRA